MLQRKTRGTEDENQIFLKKQFLTKQNIFDLLGFQPFVASTFRFSNFYTYNEQYS